MNVLKSEATAQTAALPSAPLPSLAAERTIRFVVRDDGICVLTFDRPGSSANIFDLRTLDELAQELEFIERQPELKGVIFISGKRSVFIAGLDLNLVREITSPTEARALIERGQAVMNRIAALKIPTVAAVHGAAVGGGYELCLACDYRIASPDHATKIGLPEIKIGLLPGWGGSTRLPRLIGLPKALDIILGGKTVAAKHALKLGMVDEMAPSECLVAAAVRKIKLGKPVRSNHWLTNNRLVASAVAPQVRKQILKKTRGHYPAVLQALEVVTRGISQTVAASLALEREGIVALMQTGTCHNLINVFFLQERARKRTFPAASSAEPNPVARTAVIGAGVMGAGIAQWISARKLPVILRDINTEQVAKGMATIAKLYRDGVKRHTFTAHEARAGMDRVHPAPAEVPLHRADLVIEAAVENLELKKKIFQRLDELVSPETVLATNTSALPISEMAAGTRHPERVVGLHFFNPVHRMQLVEVIAARQTAPEVIQRALKFAQQIGKLPVVVQDSPGFLVNRILMPYLIEAGNLFEAGAKVEDLDEVMLDFGMPMGPMRLLDEVGLDVSLHVAATLAAHFGDRMKVPDCLRKMTGAGFLGRKNGRGFYLHEKSKEARPNPQNSACVQSQKAREITREELQERMVFLMVNEAARCLEEQIVTDPADVDFAMIMGTGFAPFRGGPLRYTDTVGAARLVGAMNHLVASGTAHFEPCKLLAGKAASGDKFYPND
ncbi:MAG: 3-hydroxyacyl-CoA dehydrogenase NAD-binding domain-containing protein [Verrucomicrobiales bacterium]|nr:3-hydroxyacyl-CoA dehydrogenase NAD-binding domain-containing protein [Verrucomicrobiales bacterium]